MALGTTWPSSSFERGMVGEQDVEFGWATWQIFDAGL
jgi:hypothetical protein